MPKDNKHDDFDAVRALVDTLSPFEVKDRERIIRWACEKLSMASDAVAATTVPVIAPMPRETTGADAGAATLTIRPVKDIKSFVQEKSPKSDQQLAAVVAYFYKFEAPADQQKETISGSDLQDACRKADCTRPARPAQTMLNAFNAGYFDKADHGQYRLNSVGENLVAMVLPAGSSDAKPRTIKRRIGKAVSKKKR